MIQIKPNVALKPLNTFGIHAIAENLVTISSVNDIFQALVDRLLPYKVIGGGSNILLKNANIKDYLYKMEIKGIEIIDEDENQALVQVGAGENWHQFVLWCLSHDLGGLENLSLIPGRVGAAPIQNIGAYGVEQNACFHSLKGVNTDLGISLSYFKDDCQFGYRDSIFKHQLKGKFVITHVRYLLQKNSRPSIQYADIKQKLQDLQIEEPTIQQVSQAIIAIRQHKLPDISKYGNAGSFFKNPVIPAAQATTLLGQYDKMPHYTVSDELTKIPAAWLIEQCGFKGKQLGQTGSYHQQALVIVNYGGATGQEVVDYAQLVIDTVHQTFGIVLEMEVNVWG